MESVLGPMKDGHKNQCRRLLNTMSMTMSTAWTMTLTLFVFIIHFLFIFALPFFRQPCRLVLSTVAVSSPLAGQGRAAGQGRTGQKIHAHNQTRDLINTSALINWAELGCRSGEISQPHSTLITILIVCGINSSSWRIH